MEGGPATPVPWGLKVTALCHSHNKVKTQNHKGKDFGVQALASRYTPFPFLHLDPSHTELSNCSFQSSCQFQASRGRCLVLNPYPRPHIHLFFYPSKTPKCSHQSAQNTFSSELSGCLQISDLNQRQQTF